MDVVAYNERGREEKQILSEFLDTMPPVPAETIEAIDAGVWRDIDCTTCANCCKTMTPKFTVADIARLATHLRLSPAAFKARWLIKGGDGDWENKSRPCQFLDGNMCTVYEARPADCAGFPHHEKRPFDQYKATFKNNVAHCPATLTFVERLREVTEKADGAREVRNYDAT